MYKSLFFVALGSSRAELKTLETCKGEKLPGKIYEFSESKNKTLYFLDTNLKKNFGEARIFCETSILTGGNLWCPSSQKEYNSVAKDVLKADFAYLGIQRVFDQTNPLAERESTDSWECVHNKETQNFTFWDSWYAEEPQPSTKENYDVVFGLGYETDFRGTWHSGNPSQPMSVFCQIYCDEEVIENIETIFETDKLSQIKTDLDGIEIEGLDDNLAKLIGQIKNKINKAFLTNDPQDQIFSDENLLKMQTIVEHLKYKKSKSKKGQEETSESDNSDSILGEDKTQKLNTVTEINDESNEVSETEDAPLLPTEDLIIEDIFSDKADATNEFASELNIAQELINSSGPTNIQTYCDVNSLVNLEFDFLGSKTVIDPMSIRAGSCSLRTPHAFSIATHEHDGYNHWTIRFNANLCGGIFQDNYNNFVQDSTTDVTFENVVFEDADGGRLEVPLVIKDHIIKTRCRYKSEHTVKLSFGDTKKSHEEISENTGGIGFSFSAYDNPAYVNSMEAAKTGEMIFVKLEPRNIKDAVGVDYVFSKCGFEEQTTGKFVTLFDAETGDGCHNELIPGLEFNGLRQLDNGIGFEYRMFGTSQRTKESYDLECNVKVCLIDETDECDKLRNACSLRSTIVTVPKVEFKSMRM